MADEHTFDRRMSALLQQLATLPEGLDSSCSEGDGAARNEKVRTALDNLQSSMDWLRVSVKYLVFDLEATKRDNERFGEDLKDIDGPPMRCLADMFANHAYTEVITAWLDKQDTAFRDYVPRMVFEILKDNTFE